MTKESLIPPERVIEFVTGLLKPVMHEKRACSVALAVLGALHAERFSIAEVGRAMARVRGSSPKHGIKQFDRLLSNAKFDVEKAFAALVPWVVADREAIVVSLDWTEYAADGHSRIAINLITRHGRATPLVWKTVRTDNLKGRRNLYEDELLYLLAKVLPPGVHVTLLADRGFGDIKLYQILQEELAWDFVIRFRAGILVETPDGRRAPAGEWVPANGQILEIPDARVTSDRFPIGVVCVKAPRMKEAWCLATPLKGQKDRAVQLYGRRFTCEENFRDEKDRHFGFGFLETRLGDPKRRDRFLFVGALAMMLLTLLGGAGEQLGCDRQLKANTTPRRSHSLLRQGREYIAGSARRFMTALQQAFEQLLSNHVFERATFGFI